MDALPSTGLPPGWAIAKLGDLGTWTGGGTPSKSRDEFWTGGTVPWVSPKDMKAARVGADAERITEAAVAQSAAKLVSAGSVLCVVRSGILQHTFPVAIAEQDVTLNQDMRALTPTDGISAEYLRHYLRYRNDDILHTCSKDGTTVASIEQPRLHEFPVPLAPEDEQTRIVAAVNALFEEVEAGEAALARAREGLTQFRASLLHAACTSALTADWRAANPTNETGHDLLAELLAERRERWEAEFRAKAARSGKRLRDDTWKARYPTPRAPDLTDMPELQHGWTWASLDQLAHDSNYGTSVKCDADADGLAVLRIPNVQAGAVTWSNLKFAADDLGLEATDLLAPGDLLVVRTNGSPDLVGRAALIEGQPERLAYFASYLIRFRLLGSATVRRWVASVFRSGLVRTQVARFAATSAGQYNVSQTNLAGFAIPLPPEDEIEAALDALTEAAADDGALPPAGFADQLRQSILHAAFTGRLVPQDPADEPAGALLAHLRATPTTTRRPRQRRATAQPDLIETQA